MNQHVAIILVNWNGFEVTHNCILSLKASGYPFFTIVVVDNDSTDGSADKLQSLHPDIVLIRSATNTGFTGGNNLGFLYSLAHDFAYSMMLNNDTFVEPGFLTHLINYLEAHTDVAAVQPRIHFNHDRRLLWNGGSYFNKWTGFTYTKGENKLPRKEHLVVKEVDWITGCAFVIRNNILRETGLLAESMFMYYEDVDLSFRLHENGYKMMYVPQSIIYHIAGASTKSKTKGKEGYVNKIVHYYNQRNRLWILKRYTKWYCVPTVTVANFFYILLVMCYFAARGRFNKFKVMIDAVKDGLSGNINTIK